METYLWIDLLRLIRMIWPLFYDEHALLIRDSISSSESRVQLLQVLLQKMSSS